MNQEFTNGTSNFEPGEAEFRALARKVQDQIDHANEQESTFKRARERKAASPRLRYTAKDFDKFIEKLENPQCSALELTPGFAKTRTSDKYYENLRKIAEDYPYYMDGLESMSEFNEKEERMLMKLLFQSLSIPRRVIRHFIKYRKKYYRLSFDLLVRASLLCLYAYLVMKVVSQIILPLLKWVFLTLNAQLSKVREKFKNQGNPEQTKEEQMEESKNFWDKHLGDWSEWLNFPRGGSLVPIREVNIYEFSELDQEQALLFASPIPAYIQLERSKLELEKFLVDSERTLTRRKRLGRTLKKFSSTLNAVPSKLGRVSSKLKKLKESIKGPSKEEVFTKMKIVIGSLFFLWVVTSNGGTLNLRRPQNISNYPDVPAIERREPLVRPRVAPYMKEASQKPNFIMSERKDSLPTSSPLKSVERVRKKSKLTGLWDLPPLPDQNFDLEVDSTPIPRSSAIKIRVE
jgi:hypothetical protein